MVHDPGHVISNITVCTNECGRVAGIVGMLLRVPWYRVCTNVLYNTNAAPCIHDAGVAGDDTYDRSGDAQIHHLVDVGSSTLDIWMHTHDLHSRSAGMVDAILGMHHSGTPRVCALNALHVLHS